MKVITKKDWFLFFSLITFFVWFFFWGGPSLQKKDKDCQREARARLYAEIQERFERSELTQEELAGLESVVPAQAENECK